MVEIQQLASLPITQLIVIGIVFYFLFLGARTLKAWLRLLEVKALYKEYEITKTDKDFKEIVEQKFSKNKITSTIENNLIKEQEK